MRVSFVHSHAYSLSVLGTTRLYALYARITYSRILIISMLRERERESTCLTRIYSVGELFFFFEVMRFRSDTGSYDRYGVSECRII